jgi:nitrite reductase (NO-forming)
MRRMARRLVAGILIAWGSLWAVTPATAVTSNLEKPPAAYRPDVSYTFRTHIGREGMVFVGVGGAIDKVVNPKLKVPANAIVQITLINDDGAEHDIAIPEFKTSSDHVAAKGASSVIVFRASKNGTFDYFCTLPGHRQAGMQGKIEVGGGAPAAKASTAANIVRDPADLPQPVGKREPRKIRYDLVTEEVKGRLADGTTFNYWTFNGKVPGPFLRVRVGDTVELRLKNAANSRMIHSIDLHGATGPGGGATVTQAAPGEEKVVTFKALKTGLYVYHCATPMVAHHIANGMYGMILVEPEEGLPKVDREFYVMQGELYTTSPFGHHGEQEFNVQKLLDERPEYFVFNGAVGALTHTHPMQAKVGETVRIYFGVGGPNFTSSFHVIGEIFDKVYTWASLDSPPVEAVQTVSVPAGGAVVVDFKLDVPGRYILVDHALSRLERGLAGFINVTGKPDPSIFHPQPEIGAGGH